MDAGYVSSLQSRRIPSRLKATCVNRWCPAPQTHTRMNLHAPEKGGESINTDGTVKMSTLRLRYIAHKKKNKKP